MSLLSDIKKNKKKMDKALGLSKKPAAKAPAKTAAPKASAPKVIVKYSRLVKFDKDAYIKYGTDYEWEMDEERYVVYYEDNDYNRTILGYLPATLNSFMDKYDDGQSVTFDVMIDGSVILIYSDEE